MRIQLEQIRVEPYRWSEVLQIPTERLGDSEIVELGEVTWNGEIRYAAPGFRLIGGIDYEQTVRCMRCLETVTLPAHSDLDVTIFLEAADIGPGEYELDEGDFGVIFADSEVFDVEPLLIEKVHLEIPMRTLCRDGCQGLCPTCGGNRNETECDCDNEPVDPRWAALERLKGKNN